VCTSVSDGLASDAECQRLLALMSAGHGGSEGFGSIGRWRASIATPSDASGAWLNIFGPLCIASGERAARPVWCT
jgi:hypothetical protein